MRLELTLQAGDGATTGFVLDEETVASFGRGRRVPVTVTVGDATWRTSIAFYRGAFMVSVPAEARTRAGIAAGDTVTVDLEVDDAPRTVDVPADLATALDGRPGARAAFDALSYSRRRAHVEQVTGAKTDGTRATRVQKVLETLLP